MHAFQSKLSGSHALVTGGSKGIGHSIVESYLAEGVNVSFCSRNIRGDEFSQFKGAADHARAVGSSVDIGNAAEIKAWVAKAHQEFGKIDIVVANASPLLTAATAEAWELSFRADIMGLITIIEAATPHLTEQSMAGGNASIVVISSLAGFEARHPSIAGPYSTFKRAQATLAKDFSRKLAHLGIRINTVIPGSIENPGITRSDGTVEPSSFQKKQKESPELFKALLNAVPLGRMGVPEEIANTVLFLSSPLAGYICGANLVVDGGMSMFF